MDTVVDRCRYVSQVFEQTFCKLGEKERNLIRQSWEDQPSAGGRIYASPNEVMDDVQLRVVLPKLKKITCNRRGNGRLATARYADDTETIVALQTILWLSRPGSDGLENTQACAREAMLLFERS